MDPSNRSQIQIPLKTEDITPEWLSQILNVSINATSLNISTNIAEGTGFLSNLLRVSCKESQPVTKDTAQSQDQEIEHHLIIKLLPITESVRGIVVGQELDKAEIRTYQQILPDLIVRVPELEQYLCKHVYSNFSETTTTGSDSEAEYGSVLVLQDLKSLGYNMIDFCTESMSDDQIKASIDFLAKFHFASKLLEIDVAQNSLKKLLPEIYPFLQHSEDFMIDSPFYFMLKLGFQQVDDLFVEFPQGKNTENIRANYQKLAKVGDDIINLVFKPPDSSWKCLIHGDLWSNNILFKNDSANCFKVIDWQLLNYSDSTRDLGVFIFSSLTESELTKENVDRLVRFYFKQYVKNFEQLNCKMFSNLEAEFCKHFYTFGMMYTFVWFVLSLEPFSKDVSRMITILKFFENEMNVSEMLLEHLSNA